MSATTDRQGERPVQDQARPAVRVRSIPPTRRVLGWVTVAAVIAAVIWTWARPASGFAAVAAGLVIAGGAATLASYLPAVGRRLDLGCTPCAVVAGLSVPLAVVLLGSDMPGLAVVVAAGGLVQRLRRPATCTT